MSRKTSWPSMLAIAATAALAVAGCGSDDSSSSSTGSSSAGAATASAGASTAASTTAAAATGGTIDVGVGKITPKAGNKKIAFFGQATKAYTYTVAQVKAAQAEGEKLGYTVDAFYSNLDPATELQNFNQAMSGKYAGVVFQPVNSQLCTPAKTQGLKNNVVIGVVGNALCNDGTGVGDELWSPGTAFYIGGANAVDGVTAVLEKAAADNPGPQKVAFVMGIKGHPSTNAWEAAWKKFSPTHPDMKLVTTQYTDFTTPTSFKTTQDILQGHPDINIIFDLYIDVGVGVAKAIDSAGKTGKIKLYENGGGSKVAKALVEKGQITGDLPVYPADNGRVGIQQMVEALQGKQPPKYTGGDGNPDFSATGLITKENAASFDPQS